MHFVYRLFGGNENAALREQRINYPDRNIPSPQVFTQSIFFTVQAFTPTFDKSGSVQKPCNEVGPALDHNVDKQILQRVEENPEISSRRLAATIKERKT